MLIANVGCMRSGKSKKLIQDFNALDSVFGHDNILVLKPAIDTRDPAITSRGLSQTLACYYIGEDTDWKDRLLYLHGTEDVIVMVDELQFLTPEDVRFLERNSSTCLMYGLDRDFTSNRFPAFKEVETLTTKINYMTAICDSCGQHNATYTKLVGTTCTNEEHILVGDEVYSPRCIKCF